MTLRPRWIVACVAVLATTLTVAFSVLPFVRFAYRAPELHVAIETAAGVIGALAAYLFVARFLRGGRLSDLALAWGLGIFSVTNLFLAALPAALAEGQPPAVATWGAIACRLLGAGAFVFGAFGGRVLGRRGRALTAAAALGAAALALGIVVPWLARSALPVAVDPTLSPEQSGQPLVAGDPSVLAIQLVVLALFAATAAGFARQADRSGDDLLRWIAIGGVLAAAARLNYFLFPSLYSEWVYTGDFFRLAFYLSVLVGAAREVGVYWRSAAGAAVLEERRRIARDLHDGLAQELAFIAGQAARLRVEPLEAAAGRALGEARRAIAALTRPLDEPLADVIADVAEEVAEREGLNLELEIGADPDLAPEAREQLVRIVREALTNAARHARARTVRVEVANGNGLRVTVADDGVGFDPAALPPGDANEGFGLISMRERALALGGELRVLSRPGVGTSVEVFVP